MSRLRHEAGQTVVLFAVLLPLFLGLGAIAVDIGYWYVVKKTAQDAADAAALAAARELPSCTDPGCPAYELAKTYVEDNMPGAEWNIEHPYTPDDAPQVGVIVDGTPDPSKIKVTVTHSARTFFGRAFGVFDATITRRAVAERLGGTGNLAIFSHSRECDADPPLEFAGQEVYINGLVHANGRFRVSSGPFWAAEGTHNKPNCPSSIDSGVQSQFGEDMPPPAGTACAGAPCREPNDDVFQDWPAWFTPAQFGWHGGCTRSGDVIEITEGVVRIDGEEHAFAASVPSGTYCARRSFTMNGDGLTGMVTALAPEISVDGRDQVIAPYAHDVLFFAVPNADDVVMNDGPVETGPLECSDTAMTLSGARNTWSGIVFSPCGLVSVNVGESSAGSPALAGAILAASVKITGSEFYMDGDENLTLPPHLALVE